MSAIPASYTTGLKCPQCNNAILAGEMVVLEDRDRFIHEECERHPDAWEKQVAPATVVLKHILDKRGELMRQIEAAPDFDINRLPERMETALWELVAAEGHLLSLLQDVVSEHLPEQPQGGGIGDAF